MTDIQVTVNGVPYWDGTDEGNYVEGCWQYLLNIMGTNIPNAVSWLEVIANDPIPQEVALV